MKVVIATVSKQVVDIAIIKCCRFAMVIQVMQNNHWFCITGISLVMQLYKVKHDIPVNHYSR